MMEICSSFVVLVEVIDNLHFAWIFKKWLWYWGGLWSYIETKMNNHPHFFKTGNTLDTSIPLTKEFFIKLRLKHFDKIRDKSELILLRTITGMFSWSVAFLETSLLISPNTSRALIKILPTIHSVWKSMSGNRRYLPYNGELESKNVAKRFDLSEKNEIALGTFMVADTDKYPLFEIF